jgi:hypothetical protein
MEPTSSPILAVPTSDGGPAFEGPSLAKKPASRIERAPKGVGVLLLTAGVVTGMLPPPPGPFDISLMLAGGVMLWPRGLRAADEWSRRRFPQAHRAGMRFLERYLDDLERRYPGSTV